MVDFSGSTMDNNHVLLQQGVPVAPLPPSLRPQRFPMDNFTIPQNTQMYGWTPEVYPNPLVDTARCGIDYLTEDNNLTCNMRLCDPDWVLGRSGLDDIAKSLYNFSTTFGVAADNRHWEVVVEHEEPSNGRSRIQPPSRRNLGRREPFQDKSDEEAEIAMLLRGSLFQHEAKRPLNTADETKDANSDALWRSLFGLNIFSPMTADSDQGRSWVMVPPVELAVATVRKVR